MREEDLNGGLRARDERGFFLVFGIAQMSLSLACQKKKLASQQVFMI